MTRKVSFSVEQASTQFILKSYLIKVLTNHYNRALSFKGYITVYITVLLRLSVPLSMWKNFSAANSI